MKLELDVKGLVNKVGKKVNTLAEKEDNEYKELKNLNIPYHFRLLRYISIALYVIAFAIFIISTGNVFEFVAFTICILGGIMLTGTYAIITAMYMLNQPKTDPIEEVKNNEADDTEKAE